MKVILIKKSWKYQVHQNLQLPAGNDNILMFHSDQGTQYSAHLFTRYLKELKITQSMSRRGNCWEDLPRFLGIMLSWKDFLDV